MTTTSLHRRKALAGLGILGLSGLINPWKTIGMVLPKVAKRTIHSSGEQLPCVDLGTWLTFDIGSSSTQRLERKKIVEEMIRYGSIVIDSSPMYGRSEAVVGDVTKDLEVSQQLFLATKVWTSGKKQGQEQIRRSQGLMQKSPLDLLQIHNLVDWSTHIRTLMDLKAAGTVRYIGVTHYLEHAYPEMEKILKAYPLDFIQVNYSLQSRSSAERLLPSARDKGVAVIVNRPFEGGNLFRLVRDKPLPAVARDLHCNSWAQLFLKYILANDAVTCPIPGTSQPSHMVENALAGTGRLPTAAEKKKIEEALKA